jgi:hypothetical protein
VRVRAFLAAAVVLTMATSAQAISLVVMATNSTAVAGAKVYTIGIQVTAADVAAGGSNPVLFAQNVTFTGSATGPIHAATTKTPNANQPDVQGVQSNFIDANANAPPDNAGLTANGITSLYKDSWWYNSSSGNGLLTGVIDSAGDVGPTGPLDTPPNLPPVTTNLSPDGSGVYTMGAFPNSGTNAVGTTGYVFFPSGAPGAVPANPTTGQTMAYSGLFGPTGANFFNASPGDPNHVLGNLLVANGGTLTVPIAQIIASGNIALPSALNGGAGTFLEAGTPIYNVLGGPANVDPGAFLDYTTNTIHGTIPEPGSLVLAGLGVLGLALAWKRRK